MKKVITFVLAILIIPLIAVAEQAEFSIEGEWYCSSMLTKQCHIAERDDSGNFHVQYTDGEIVFCTDGTVKGSPEVSEITFLQISGNEAIAYEKQSDYVYGYLFMLCDDGYRMYSIDTNKTVLLLNGNMIPYGDGEAMQYLLSGDMVYITQDEEYCRGCILPCGEDAFILNLEAEQSEYSGSFDPGTPFLLFVRSSVLQ